MKIEKCKVRINGKKCRSTIDLYFYGRGICQAHYDQYCNGFIDLKKHFKILKKPLNFIVPNFSGVKSLNLYAPLYAENHTHTHTHLKKTKKGVLN